MSSPKDTLLAELSDSELESEISKRRKERERRIEAEHTARFDPICGSLHEAEIEPVNSPRPIVAVMRLVNAICPTHDRNTCGDKDKINGWYSNQNEEGNPHCVRCALLQTLLGEQSVPLKYYLKLYIGSKP